MASQEHYKGAVSELFVQLKMMEKGYDVFTPVMSQSTVDLVVIRQGVALKVQVKKLTEVTVGTSNFMQARLQGSMNGKYLREYDRNSFDYLALTDMKDIWMVPWELVYSHKSISIGSGKRKVREWDIHQYKLTH